MSWPRTEPASAALRSSSRSVALKSPLTTTSWPDASQCAFWSRTAHRMVLCQCPRPGTAYTLRSATGRGSTAKVTTCRYARSSEGTASWRAVAATAMSRWRNSATPPLHAPGVRLRRDAPARTAPPPGTSYAALVYSVKDASARRKPPWNTFPARSLVSCTAMMFAPASSAAMTSGRRASTRPHALYVQTSTSPTARVRAHGAAAGSAGGGGGGGPAGGHVPRPPGRVVSRMIHCRAVRRWGRGSGAGRSLSCASSASPSAG